MKTQVRKDFEKWYIETKCGTSWEAWQHQESRIAELEAQVQQLQRVPLSEVEIAVACGWRKGCSPLPKELHIARAIEAAHNIK